MNEDNNNNNNPPEKKFEDYLKKINNSKERTPYFKLLENIIEAINNNNKNNNNNYFIEIKINEIIKNKHLDMGLFVNNTLIESWNCIYNGTESNNIENMLDFLSGSVLSHYFLLGTVEKIRFLSSSN